MATLSWTCFVFVAAITSAAAQSPAPIASGVTLEQIESQLEAVESSPDLSSPDNAGAAELLQSARDALTQAKAASERIAQLRTVTSNGPQQVIRLKRELELPQTTQTTQIAEDASIEQLEGLVRRVRAETQALDTRVGELENDVAAFTSAPRTLRQQADEAERALAAARSTTQAPSGGVLAPIQSIAASARLRALELSAQKIRLELESLDLREEITALERDLAKKQLLAAREHTDSLESLLSERRAQTARATREDAERVRREAAGAATVVKRLAEENSALAQQLSVVIDNLSDLSVARHEIEQTLSEIEQKFHTARARLDVAGLSSALGTLLREQRKALPDARTFKQRAIGRQQRIAQVSVAQFEADDELAKLGNLDDAVALEMAAADAPAIDAANREAVASEVRTMLADRRKVLQRLRSSYIDQLNALGELEFVEQRLSHTVTQFAEFLDETLLWIPSAAPVSLLTLQHAMDGVRWLFAYDHLRELPRAIFDAVAQNPLSMIGVVIIVVMLLRAMRRFRARYSAIAIRVRHISTDHFSLTAEALLISLLIVLPVPLLLGYLGFQLTRPGVSSEYVTAIGSGLLAVAVPFFVVRAFRTLYIPDGLGIAHFQWSNMVCVAMRRKLRVFILVLLPAVFVFAAMRSQSDLDMATGLGRIAFVVISLALVWMIRAVLHAERGIWMPFLTRSSDSWASRLRRLWFPLAAAMPAVLTGLSLFGYHYTAVRLSAHQGMSIRLLAGAFVIYYLVMRAIEVAERRLALDVARREHAEQLRQQQEVEQEAGGEAQAVPLDVPRLDMETINAQTRRLTRIVIGWSVVIGLYLIWADVLPALNIMDGVTLWQSEESSGGEITQRVVTLGDLALALVLGIVFFIAARNLPGVLEIAVLSRLPVDAGVRYATSMLVQYLVIAIGVVMVFESIGVGWGKVQWLVAALGVGLGFGLQEIFANFVSGIIILFERPVRIGDTVTLGELTGTVSRIRIRATTVTDWDRKEIVIPNKTFITERLINWTLSDQMTRVVIPIGVAYGSNTELVHRLISEQAAANVRVLHEPTYQVFFLGFGESTLDFELRVFVNGLSNMLAVRHELHLAIDRSFREHGVEIAFPQRDLHIRSSVPFEFRTGNGAPTKTANDAQDKDGSSA